MITLVIDSNFICHQAKYTMGGMSHNDIATGVLYGFLSRMLVLAEQFHTNDFIFCWDSKSSKRQEIFPAYKIKRRTNKTPEEIEERKVLSAQMTILRREILPVIGFNNNFVQKGYEGDDVVASITQGWKGEFVMVASDQDLYQLLRNNTKMYEPTKRKMITVASFTEEYGITPQQWVDVKTYAGCKGDGVPGITGIGEKTCLQYLKGELNPKSKKYQLLESAWGTGALYRTLVQLPFPKSKMFVRKKDTFSMKGLAWVARTYGMSSFLKNPKKAEWKELFTMKPEEEVTRKKARKPKRKKK